MATRQRTLRVKLDHVSGDPDADATFCTGQPGPMPERFVIHWTDGRRACSVMVIDPRTVRLLYDFAARVNDYRDERARELGLPAPEDEV